MAIARVWLSWDILRRNINHRTCSNCRRDLEVWLADRTLEGDNLEPQIDSFHIINLGYKTNPISKLNEEMRKIFKNCKSCKLNMYAVCEIEDDEPVIEEQIII